MRLALCILALFLAACSSPAPKQTAEPIIMVMSPDSLSIIQAKAWAKDIAKVEREPFAILFVHGTTREFYDRDGVKQKVWWMACDPPRTQMEMENQVAAIKNVMPNRVLWVVSCNEGAHRLKTPGVKYARNIVYSLPNSATALWPWRRGDWVGSVDRFVSTDGTKHPEQSPHQAR